MKMSLVNLLTIGLVHKDGEEALVSSWGMYSKSKDSQYWVSDALRDFVSVYLPLFPIWLLSLCRLRCAMKLIGQALGYSCCSNCGMPWKYVQWKNIHFSPSEGMFPLCEKCFNSLGPEEIDRHIEKLVLRWWDDSIKYGYDWGKEPPQKIIESAKAEVRRIKANQTVKEGNEGTG